jgi:hypothetical protein
MRSANHQDGSNFLQWLAQEPSDLKVRETFEELQAMADGDRVENAVPCNEGEI